MLKNYYKTLNIHPDADPEIVDVAYRRLAQKYHPDVNSDGKSSSLMAEINEAYRILRNPESRKKYDVERRAFLRERKKEKLAAQTNVEKPSSPSRWLQNLDLWCSFSTKQRTWIAGERKKIEIAKSKLQKFVSDIQELYKLTGYGILQTLSRSLTEADIVIEGKSNTKTYVVHVDISETEIDLEKIKIFKSEIQKANFAQGAFFIQGRFSKQATEWANANSVRLVDFDSFTRFLSQAREKERRS